MKEKEQRSAEVRKADKVYIRHPDAQHTLDTSVEYLGHGRPDIMVIEMNDPVRSSIRVSVEVRAEALAVVKILRETSNRVEKMLHRLPERLGDKIL